MISSVSKRRIASNYLLYRGELLRNGVIEIDSSGKVLSVGSVERLDSLSSTEFFSGLMFAGMVNAHCHIELSHLQGVVSEQCGFASFAAQLSASRERFSAEDVQRAIAHADLAMRREGVVAVGDVSNSCDSLAVKAVSPIHYHTFAEHFGLRRTSSDHLAELLRAENSSLTPHAIYSVTDDCFRAIASQGTAPLSIHFMETVSERELFMGRGELHDWYAKVGFECDFLHYGSPARRIVESIPKNRSVILVHNVDVDQKDIDTIMNHFSAPVYWALCPRSNNYISGRKPPVELLRKNNLKICLGTDSLSSNHSLSMIEEIKMLEGVPLKTRLEWATKNGAEALGLSHLGEVEIDKRPSLVVLSGVDFERDTIGENYKINKII
ncbi:MAG: amidohydrolase family protein [Rikenellaceae bacterium]